MVDWSANSTPKIGKDSIWLALAERTSTGLHLHALANPSTRRAAKETVAQLLTAMLATGKHVLAGFDFPLGYPKGTAEALGLGGNDVWLETWRLLAAKPGLKDQPGNRNDRFQVASDLNKRMGSAEGPFWGTPATEAYAHLKATKPGSRDHLPPEMRLCDELAIGAKSVWQLYYAGSVGGQALTGIPVVHSLFECPNLRGRCRVWPFETGLQELAVRDTHRPIVFAEIYPALVKTRPQPHEQILDRAQVKAMVAYAAILDDRGELGRLFAGATGLCSKEREAIEQEEGWILGLSGPFLNVDNAFDPASC